MTPRRAAPPEASENWELQLTNAALHALLLIIIIQYRVRVCNYEL